MAVRPIPGGPRPVRIATTDGRDVDPSATQRALDDLHTRLNNVEGAARELGTSTTGASSWLGRRVLTGSGLYTPTPGTTRVLIRMIGGGGGGGGALDSGQPAAAAGGSSGTLLEIALGDGVAALVGGPYSCGAGGAAGSALGGNGGSGGDTRIVVNRTPLLATGGGGGTGLANAALTNANVNSTIPAAGSSTGGLLSCGLGDEGIIIGGAAWFSGDGGSTSLGAGGITVGGTTAGNPGSGYGSGGGGGASGSGGVLGGAGAAGAVVIDEFGSA